MQEQIPNYWRVAHTFTLCDHFHTEVRGPSAPNYFMLTSAQSPIVDAQAGALPHIAWLISEFDVSGHPPASLCVAENWMARVLNAITHGPQWGSTTVFLTWDDWGGFYDHVEPPILEAWSDGTSFRLGHRAPCIVASPYAKAGFVSHQLYSHASLLRFIETIFELEPLTERDAQAGEVLDCFDFGQPPLAPIDLQARTCDS